MLGDLLVKVARNERLSQSEITLLRKFGYDTQNRNSQVAGFTYQQGGLKYDNSFVPIFSEIFETDRDSFSVEIPQDYNHLIIIFSGRSTGVLASVIGLFGSVGSSHTRQFLTADLTTVDSIYTAFADSGTAPLGFLTEAGESASIASSTVCFIMNFRQQYYKSAIPFVSRNYDDSNSIRLINSTWRYTPSIERIDFISGDDLIAKGSVVTVYGVR
jgi:hypothetical protein